MLRTLQKSLKTYLRTFETFNDILIVVERSASIAESLLEEGEGYHNLIIRICEPVPKEVNYDAPELFLNVLQCPVQVDEPAGWNGNSRALEIAQAIALAVHGWVPSESVSKNPVILGETSFWKVLETPEKDGRYRLQINFETSTFVELSAST
jgi:hypothetical protein